MAGAIELESMALLHWNTQSLTFGRSPNGRLDIANS